MDNKELVSALRKQHKNLSENISKCLEEVETDSPDYEKILEDLRAFNKDLGGHLDMENDIFYPELLQYLGGKGLPISGIEKFIEEMMGVQEKMDGFFAKYDNIEKVKGSENDFAADLREMAAILSLRIEAEDDCAYVYFE